MGIVVTSTQRMMVPSRGTLGRTPWWPLSWATSVLSSVSLHMQFLPPRMPILPSLRFHSSSCPLRGFWSREARLTSLPPNPLRALCGVRPTPSLALGIMQSPQSLPSQGSLITNPIRLVRKFSLNLSTQHYHSL